MCSDVSAQYILVYGALVKFHVLRISLSLHSQTRDKESSEPKLTSWSLLLNAPTADQDKATQSVCHSAKTGSGRNPSDCSWSPQGFADFARVLMSLWVFERSLPLRDMCGNQVVSSSSRSAFDLNVPRGQQSTPTRPFQNIPPWDCWCKFEFQTAANFFNNHDSWIPKSVVKQR